MIKETYLNDFVTLLRRFIVRNQVMSLTHSMAVIVCDVMSPDVVTTARYDPADGRRHKPHVMDTLIVVVVITMSAARLAC